MCVRNVLKLPPLTELGATSVSLGEIIKGDGHTNLSCNKWSRVTLMLCLFATMLVEGIKRRRWSQECQKISQKVVNCRDLSCAVPIAAFPLSFSLLSMATSFSQW